jgi:hypothetical protein
MSELTTVDIIQLNKVAINRVANCLNLETEDRTFTQIFSNISDTEDPLYELLDSLIAIYRQYQNFHLILDEKEFNGDERTSQDTKTLMNHMNRRDNARQDLINALVERNA